MMSPESTVKNDTAEIPDARLRLRNHLILELVYLAGTLETKTGGLSWLDTKMTLAGHYEGLPDELVRIALNHRDEIRAMLNIPGDRSHALAEYMTRLLKADGQYISVSADSFINSLENALKEYSELVTFVQAGGLLKSL